MELKKYQINAFAKIIRNDKSVIIWPRQIGKSYLLYYYIENYIINNSDKKILFFSNDERQADNNKGILLKNINRGLIKINKKNEILFINNNTIKFFSIQENYINALFIIQPDLIIYDEFYYQTLLKIKDISDYVDHNRLKSIFTLSYIDLNLIKILDDKRDCYFNIVLDSDINRSFMIKNFSYKSDELLDYDDIIFQRIRKLKKLNLISNGS